MSRLITALPATKKKKKNLIRQRTSRRHTRTEKEEPKFYPFNLQHYPEVNINDFTLKYTQQMNTSMSLFTWALSIFFSLGFFSIRNTSQGFPSHLGELPKSHTDSHLQSSYHTSSFVVSASLSFFLYIIMTWYLQVNFP